jgi:hypothetical protein
MSARGAAAAAQPRAVVCVLGWWYSEPRLVEKYCQLYRSQGCVAAVVQETLTTLELAWPPARRLAARRLVRRLEEEVAQQRRVAERDQIPGQPVSPPLRVVFHALSNNGAVLYLATRAVAPQWLSDATVGAVFDSAPGDLSLLAGLGAVAESVRPPAAGYAGIAALALGGTLASRAVLGSAWATARTALLAVVAAQLSAIAVTHRYHSHFIDDASRAPQLFLYSDEDKLVSSQTVLKVAERRKAAGITV